MTSIFIHLFNSDQVTYVWEPLWVNIQSQKIQHQTQKIKFFNERDLKKINSNMSQTDFEIIHDWLTDIFKKLGEFF